MDHAHVVVWWLMTLSALFALFLVGGGQELIL
jgi:hypothetical protein